MRPRHEDPSFLGDQFASSLEAINKKLGVDIGPRHVILGGNYYPLLPSVHMNYMNFIHGTATDIDTQLSGDIPLETGHVPVFSASHRTPTPGGTVSPVLAETAASVFTGRNDAYGHLRAKGRTSIRRGSDIGPEGSVWNYGHRTSKSLINPDRETDDPLNDAIKEIQAIPSDEQQRTENSKMLSEIHASNMELGVGRNEIPFRTMGPTGSSSRNWAFDTGSATVRQLNSGNFG